MSKFFGVLMAFSLLAVLIVLNSTGVIIHIPTSRVLNNIAHIASPLLLVISIVVANIVGIGIFIYFKHWVYVVVSTLMVIPCILFLWLIFNMF
ncbi:hypothetical protein N5094_19775 [Shewanella putrefaciens]|uniref:hypothetical protein n=1 Tax=Shewanella putrefaciens TaxID=24 RepID=UPI0021C0D2E6|nr:hypothetical protein [Shewanella putrefaciens]UXK08578.1 hypothetical protein N5094_19775 [Shewanella putrefaciens]